MAKVEKMYCRGLWKSKPTSQRQGRLHRERPRIVGVMGPNGSGKTTLFEMLSGSNTPTHGKVHLQWPRRAPGEISRARSPGDSLSSILPGAQRQEDAPDFMLEKARSSYPLVHVFDEPQFSTQDGYIGFMLNFFQHLRATGKVVFLCVHPCEPFHVDIMKNYCERYLFVSKGQVAELPDYASL